MRPLDATHEDTCRDDACIESAGMMVKVSGDGHHGPIEKGSFTDAARQTWAPVKSRQINEIPSGLSPLLGRHHSQSG